MDGLSSTSNVKSTSDLSKWKGNSTAMFEGKTSYLKERLKKTPRLNAKAVRVIN